MQARDHTLECTRHGIWETYQENSQVPTFQLDDRQFMLSEE